jgi:hypothetical protein
MKRILEVILLITIMAFNLNAQKSNIQTKSTAYSAPFAPIPEVPAKKTLDSVSMGDLNSFSEIKLDDLPIAPGLIRQL